MILQAIKLHKIYNTKDSRIDVLKGVSLGVKKGEFLSVLGASGAGKSTLLHLLGGLDIPSGGDVLLDGANFYKIKDKERAQLRNQKIGFVFQFYHLLPEFTALENVILPGLVSGRDLNEVSLKAADLLDQVGLKSRATHYPSELSGGEQQRVAIARALINDPQILLCDEPTGNLDSKTGLRICDLLTKLNKENGYTVIVATHSEEIAEISSRRILIRDGNLVN